MNGAECLRDLPNLQADMGGDMFSPPHSNSVLDDETRPTNAAAAQARVSAQQQQVLQIPGRISSFQAAFPNVAPASVHGSEVDGGRSLSERWQIPASYRRHWERVPDILKQIPVMMQGYQSASMTPTEEHEGKMYGESKCFSLLSKSSLEHLAGPHEGMPFCFLAECLSEIPDISLKVLYFFDNVRKFLQAQDRSPYVFPTDQIGLMVGLFYSTLIIISMFF
jgi:hypothetical protein